VPSDGVTTERRMPYARRQRSATSARYRRSRQRCACSLAEGRWTRNSGDGVFACGCRGGDGGIQPGDGAQLQRAAEALARPGALHAATGEVGSRRVCDGWAFATQRYGIYRAVLLAWRV